MSNLSGQGIGITETTNTLKFHPSFSLVTLSTRTDFVFPQLKSPLVKAAPQQDCRIVDAIKIYPYPLFACNAELRSLEKNRRHTALSIDGFMAVVSVKLLFVSGYSRSGRCNLVLIMPREEHVR